MMNKAFVAASVAEKEGFHETAKAFNEIAIEAFLLINKSERADISPAAAEFFPTQSKVVCRSLILTKRLPLLPC